MGRKRINLLTTAQEKFRLTKRGILYTLYDKTKNNATRRNIEFTITKEDIAKKLKKGKCEISGIKFVLNTLQKHPFKPSIDRINNLKGYTPDNIQIVCQIYNFAKNTFSNKDMEKLSLAITTKIREKEEQRQYQLSDCIV